jgi:hypothetical protein
MCPVSELKRAALLFDKVYVPSRVLQGDWTIPADLAFTCDRFEWDCGERACECAEEQIIEERHLDPGEYSEGEWEAISDRILESEEWARLQALKEMLFLGWQFEQKCKVSIVPVFHDCAEFEPFYGRGTDTAWAAAMKALPVVKPSVSWDAVMDFRQDKEALQKYRNLRLWFTSSFNCASLRQAEDTIAKKLDDYRWAIRKHGLETVTGAITSVAGVASASAIADMLGASLLQVLSTGLSLGAGALAWIAKKRVSLQDVKRGPDSEIAIIHDARRRF